MSPSIAERKAASVLPEPVGAATNTSRPSLIAGQASRCAGVGSLKVWSNQPRTAGLKRLRTSKRTSGRREIRAARPMASKVYFPTIQSDSSTRAQDRVIWQMRDTHHPQPIAKEIFVVVGDVVNQHNRCRRRQQEPKTRPLSKRRQQEDSQ